MKSIRYALEAIFTAFFLAFFKILPPPLASNLGGAIGRTIGPHLAVNRRALKHLRLTLPDADHAAIITGMWDNLGRVFAEYPHLEKIAAKHTEFAGRENFDSEKTPAILIAGHLANWEIAATTFFVHGTSMGLIYRAPNNPWVDKMLKVMRSLNGRIATHPKSTRGMRQVVDSLKSNHNLGILIDQKYNQGLKVNFFGRPAMTSPAFVQLAQKYGCPVYPVRVERLTGCQFRVTVHPPLDITQTPEELIRQAHTMLEQWITERPEQWIWLHRRWKELGEPPEAAEPSETLAEIG
jgi:KDO2-lipid IV(A) lauroyltransferase